MTPIDRVFHLSEDAKLDRRARVRQGAPRLISGGRLLRLGGPSAYRHQC